jgi:hypothetical protein
MVALALWPLAPAAADDRPGKLVITCLEIPDTKRGAGLAIVLQSPARHSGNVLFALVPYHLPKGATATHGSPWRYDRHVPLLIRGPGIHPGRYRARVTPAVLAPTLARLLGLEPPAGCEVEAPEEALLPSTPSKSSQAGL